MGGRVNETVDGVTSPLDARWFTTRSSKLEIDLLHSVTREQSGLGGYARSIAL
jgi:hypothetical protein